MSEQRCAFGPNDLIYATGGDGKVTAGGFSIDSCLLKGGYSPIVTMSGGGKGVSKDSDSMHNLAVPAGLLYMQESIERKYDTRDNMEVVSDSLYDRLIDLAGPEKEKKPKPKKEKKKRATRKTKGRSSGKGTRKKK